MTAPGVLAILERIEHYGLSAVLRGISKEYFVPVEAIVSRERTKRVVEARKAFLIVLRENGFSYPEIGKLLGKDHTTILAQICGKKRKP